MSFLMNITRKTINKHFLKNLQQVRHSHGEWTYRTYKDPKRWEENTSIVCMSITYWWLYWNAYHNFDLLMAYHCGEVLPNPRDWTDEELGIPPD